jgi:threonine dehydrogenase-like Zn-dependent dehydrogenase
MHGRRCAVYIPVHCGRCAACRRGDTQMCLEISSLIGWNRPGGYAEYLPVPENCLLPVPDDIEDSLAPLLLDTIGTSAHAVRFVSRVVPPDESGPVLVTGAGPVGLGVILALRDAGYGDIHVSDPNAERLGIAQTFGAKSYPVGDTSKRFALIMECSGAHAARNLVIELVLPRGALVLVGENAAPWTIEEGKIFRRKDFYMIRTFYFPIGDFEPNIALLRRYKDEYRVFVDGEFGLQALPENFARFAEGKLIKPVLALEPR